MDVASVTPDLKHPITLTDSWTLSMASITSLEEADRLMDMHITHMYSHMPATSDMDVNMADASDEQAIKDARLRDETALLLASLSSHPTLFPALGPTMAATPDASTDDVAMMDSTELLVSSKVNPPRFEEGALRSEGNGKGKGIFSYLERAVEHPTSTAQKKLEQAYIDTATSTVTADLYSNYTNTTNLASLIKRSAPSVDSITSDIPKRRRLSRLPVPSSSKPLTLSIPAPNLTSTPRELRDQIYALALLNTDTETGAPKVVNLDKLTLPMLCRSSRTILGETLPIYFAVNSFKGHLHMPHTYEHALDPASHHKHYEPANICPASLARLEANKEILRLFAVKKIAFDVLDKDLAHFCTLEIEIWKRNGGGVQIKCEGGSEVGCEVVADSERVMIEGIKDVLVPVILEMMKRDDFKGLTLDDIKALASRVVVPWKPETEDTGDDGDKAE